MTARDQAAINRRREQEPRCRACRSADGVQVHHIVPRRQTQDDSDLNLVPLCYRCHRELHERRLDMLSHLTKEEQAHAVLLTGSIESARMLLCPSAYRGGNI